MIMSSEIHLQLLILIKPSSIPGVNVQIQHSHLFAKYIQKTPNKLPLKHISLGLWYKLFCVIDHGYPLQH